ncbi:MAG: esterase, partial [Gammaproteobacteria bacterium]|nr:esterase [Gammaproteobacteria bacterium]
DGGKSVIETLFLQGPGHGWYGGNPGDFSFPEAPDIKRYIWKFFVSHPLR